MDYKNIIYEKKEGIAYIKINRPKALNALNTETITELDKAVTEIENDNNVKIAIITGEGKAFAAGADISAMKDMNTKEGLKYSKTGHDVCRHIEKVRKPFIAAINGYAFGGGFELTLACDIRFASTKAKFSLPEVGLGIMPGYGGTQRLPRIIGETKAKELIFSAGIISAEEALNLGVLNKVTEPDKLIEEAEAFANILLSKSLLAMGFAKDSINRGRDMEMDSAANLENIYVGICFSTYDLHEGMSAFIEKRDPKFEER